MQAGKKGWKRGKGKAAAEEEEPDEGLYVYRHTGYSRHATGCCLHDTAVQRCGQLGVAAGGLSALHWRAFPVQ